MSFIFLSPAWFSFFSLSLISHLGLIPLEHIDLLSPRKCLLWFLCRRNSWYIDSWPGHVDLACYQSCLLQSLALESPMAHSLGYDKNKHDKDSVYVFPSGSLFTELRKYSWLGSEVLFPTWGSIVKTGVLCMQNKYIHLVLSPQYWMIL